MKPSKPKKKIDKELKGKLWVRTCHTFKEPLFFKTKGEAEIGLYPCCDGVRKVTPSDLRLIKPVEERKKESYCGKNGHAINCPYRSPARKKVEIEEIGDCESVVDKINELITAVNLLNKTK